MYNKPAAAIYFGQTRTQEIRDLVSRIEDGVVSFSQARKEFHDMDFRSAYEFARAGRNLGETKFVTIKKGIVYIHEPASEIFDMKEEKYEKYDRQLSERGISSGKIRMDNGRIRHIPKVMFVKNVRLFKVSKVPHVLATLPCNQYLSRGTCRELDSSRQWGAIQAIKNCLGEPIETPETGKKLMSLLSPYQLETLVFLILKNAGVFPSAWRGGTQPDIDIVGINYTGSEIGIRGNPEIVFRPKERKTFQIKRGRVRKPSDVSDYTIAIDFRGSRTEKILTAEWLQEQIRTQADTKDWFENALNWTGLFG